MQEIIRQGTWLNVLDAETSTTAAPTLATDGVAVPNNLRGKHVAVRVRTASDTTATGTLAIYGYVPTEVDSDGASISGSGGWTDTLEVIDITSTTPENFAQLYEALTVYTRLDVRVTAIAGTNTEISAAFGFTEER